MDNAILAQTLNAVNRAIAHIESVVPSADQLPDFYAPLQEAADKIDAALNGTP